MPEKLCCDTIGDLDQGIARAMIDHAIATAVEDLEGRGHDSEKRKVTIELVGVKKQGMLIWQVQAKATLPAQRSHYVAAKLVCDEQGVHSMFESLSPDNADQPALPGVDGDEDNE